MRYLIVNADDFGISHGVNRGIAEAHEQGIVTSASLMVDRPGASDAADYVRDRPQLDVGLHVELRHWRVRRFPGRGTSPSHARLRRHVTGELNRQLTRFRRLTGRDPTHLDSHQHRHLAEIPRGIFEEFAQELEVPLRRTDERVSFCGDFYGQDGEGRPRPETITTEALVGLLESLADGVTELSCHPGYAGDLRDWYRNEREQEVRALCDPRARDSVERLDIRLCTFTDATAMLRGAPA